MFNAIDKLLKTIPGLTGREIAKHLDADKKKGQLLSEPK